MSYTRVADRRKAAADYERIVRAYINGVVALRRSAALATASWPYPTIEDLVLDRGRAWPTLPRRDWPRNLGWGARRHCFFNAATLATSFPDLFTYVEGFAAYGDLILPLPHAWVVDRDGRAIDVTWRRRVPPWQRCYYGVPFRADYVAASVAAQGRYGILDAWERRWPLLSVAGEADRGVLPWPS